MSADPWLSNEADDSVRRMPATGLGGDRAGGEVEELGAPPLGR